MSTRASRDGASLAVEAMKRGVCARPFARRAAVQIHLPCGRGPGRRAPAWSRLRLRLAVWFCRALLRRDGEAAGDAPRGGTATVRLRGESGTGKEVAVGADQSIIVSSIRRKGPSCASTAPSPPRRAAGERAPEGEGAFTGAVQRKPGRELGWEARRSWTRSATPR
jgi:two-component system response regulator AtoC